MKVGGVPEHFNYPWRLLESENNQLFTWREFPEGSGALIEALLNHEIDAALVLTESAVVAISKGKGLQIAGTYVLSPLPWGIHLPMGRSLNEILSKSTIRFAISRYGSGSHIMAYVLAEKYGIPIERITFVVINNLLGAVQSHAAGESDIFLWEKVITTPLVKEGKFSFGGEITSWWPSFVAVCRQDATPQQISLMKQLLNKALIIAHKVKYEKKYEIEIARHYGLSDEMVKEWLAYVEWPAYCTTDVTTLNQLHAFLNKTGMNLPLIESFHKFLL